MPSPISGHSSLISLLLAMLIAVGAYVRLSLNPMPIELAETSFLPRWMEIVAAVFALMATSIVVERVSVKMGALRGFTSLPMPIYMIVACGIFATPNALTASVAAFLSAMGVMLLLRAYNHFGSKNSVFFAGLLLGAAAIIYPPSVVFVLLLVVAVVQSPLNWRQSIVGFTGWLLPILTASYCYWYAGNDFKDVAEAFYASLARTENAFPLTPFPVVGAIMAGLMAIILVMGVVMIIINRYAMLGKARKAISFELILLGVLLGALFIPACGISVLPLLAIPVATISAYALESLPSPISSSLYWALLLIYSLHLFVA